MTNEASRVLQFYQEIQVTVAVLFGMFVQFFLGERKGLKVAFTVVVSSLFVALFIVPAIIEVANIKADSKLAIALYALSAVISIEMLSVILKVLPEAIRIRTKRFLGVEDGN